MHNFFFSNWTKKNFRCTFLGCIEIVKSTISQKLKIDFLFVSKHNAAFSHLRTCRTPPPPTPQKWWKLYERCGLCRLYLRWYTWIFKCVTDQKKCFKVTKFTGKMNNGLKRMKNQFYYFLRFLVFEILLILYRNSEKNASYIVLRPLTSLFFLWVCPPCSSPGAPLPDLGLFCVESP